MMLGENTGSPQGGRRKTCSHLIALMSTTVVLFLSCLKGRGAAAGGGGGGGGEARITGRFVLDIREYAGRILQDK